MNLRKLTHFMALAEEGRFVAAAARCHLSQAAFSRSIQALEDELGLQLVDRSTKGGRLTRVGEQVLVRARRLLFEQRNFEREITLLRGGAAGEVSIGAGPVPAGTLLPDLVALVQRETPDVVISLRAGSPHTLMELMEREALDLVFADPRVLRDGGTQVEMQRIARVTGRLYARPGHPLLAGGLVDAEALLGVGLGMVVTTPTMQAIVARSLGLAAHQPLPLRFECEDLMTLRRLALESDLLVMLPHTIASMGPVALQRVPLLHPGVPPFADLHAVWLAGRSLSPPARHVLNLATLLGRQVERDNA